jgi:CRISPR-associated protein Csd2
MIEDKVIEDKVISNRYEFVMLFDVENGNPNGDPDAGNDPRIDPETGHGYVTDVCLKRKIRNYVEYYVENHKELVKDGEKDEGKGYDILIKMDRALNTKFDEAHKNDAKGASKRRENESKARDYMCKKYYDVRTFGAVMNTGKNPCGIVRGPVQINFARSVSPINIQNISITRQAVTTEDDFEKKNNEMGRKSFIPYGLYRAEGYVSAALAQNVTGFSYKDLDLLWEAIKNMFEEDHSAARGKITMRRLYVFKHDGILGKCPANKLFDKITVTEKNPDMPPRAFTDYEVNVDTEMPDGVRFEQKL